MKKIIFATTNKNKIREAQEILGVKINGIELDIDEIQSLEPEKVIRKKAYDAYKIYKKPVLVEDTSLFFKAWKNLPGVFIDYFLKSVGIKGLIKMLSAKKNRGAVAITYLAIFNGKKYIVLEGKVRGKIAMEPRGKNGFGWDPIFIPDKFFKTFAEMDSTEKNKISMRKKAFVKLRKKIEKKMSA